MSHYSGNPTDSSYHKSSSSSSGSTLTPGSSYLTRNSGASYRSGGVTGSTLTGLDSISFKPDIPMSYSRAVSGQNSGSYSAPVSTPLTVTSPTYYVQKGGSVWPPIQTNLPRAPPVPNPHSPLNVTPSVPVNRYEPYQGLCRTCGELRLVSAPNFNCSSCSRVIEESKTPPAPPPRADTSQYTRSSPNSTSASDMKPSSSPIVSSRTVDVSRSETQYSSSSTVPSSSRDRNPSAGAAPAAMSSVQSMKTGRSTTTSVSSTTVSYEATRTGSSERSGAGAYSDREGDAFRRQQQPQPDVPRVQVELLPPIEYVSVPAYLPYWPTAKELDRDQLFACFPPLRRLFGLYKELVLHRAHSPAHLGLSEREKSPGPDPNSTRAAALEERARELVVCPDLIKAPLPQRLLSPALARCFFMSLLHWLAEVDALAISFDPVTPGECPFNQFNERFKHPLRLPSLTRFEHLLRRLELHFCLLIRRGPFVPEMALIDLFVSYVLQANSPLLIELRALLPRNYKQVLESAGYEAKEEQTSEEPSAFASDASYLSEPSYDPFRYTSESNAGRFKYSETETLSTQHPDRAPPHLILEDREVELLKHVRECFVLRSELMEEAGVLERYMSTWLALAFDCFALGELVRTADEMRPAAAAAETRDRRAELEKMPSDHQVYELHQFRTSLYLLLMLEMGVSVAKSGNSWSNSKQTKEELVRNTCERFVKMRAFFGKELFSGLLSILVECSPDKYNSRLGEMYQLAESVNREHVNAQSRAASPQYNVTVSETSTARATASEPYGNPTANPTSSSGKFTPGDAHHINSQIKKNQFQTQFDPDRIQSRDQLGTVGRSKFEGDTDADRTIGVLTGDRSTGQTRQTFDNAVIESRDRPLPALATDPEKERPSAGGKQQQNRQVQDVRQDSPNQMDFTNGPNTDDDEEYSSIERVGDADALGDSGSDISAKLFEIDSGPHSVGFEGGSELQVGGGSGKSSSSASSFHQQRTSQHMSTPPAASADRSQKNFAQQQPSSSNRAAASIRPAAGNTPIQSSVQHSAPVTSAKSTSKTAKVKNGGGNQKKNH